MAVSKRCHQPIWSDRSTCATTRSMKVGHVCLLFSFFKNHFKEMEPTRDGDRDYEMTALGDDDDDQKTVCDDEDDPFVVPPQTPRGPFRIAYADTCVSPSRWALYLGLVVVVPLVVASIVFLPWFFIGIWPDMALERSLHATTCVVLNHTVIDTRPVDGNMRLLYMPGVVVRVAAWSRTALATSHIKPGDSWMSREVMDDYWIRRPINATVACYVRSDDDVAMYPGVSGIRLGPCVAVTSVVFAFALFVTIVHIAGNHIQNT
nr:hypothetical protein [Pandoravirus massiliensis]